MSEFELVPSYRDDFRESLFRTITALTGLGVTVLMTVDIVQSFTELGLSGVVGNMDDARARRITIETADAPPHPVLADVPRLERVVGNLLTNALKYSANEAPVSVLLAHEGAEVTLAVTDRGIGIAPESVNRLFERYYRTPGGKARASGLGLGLYIARMIVEAHGGRNRRVQRVGPGQHVQADPAVARGGLKSRPASDSHALVRLLDRP